jgi:NADP-dependent 3-hydroxy acid dehydrogenase YdfG
MSAQRFQGKIAVVTGGSGIGLGVAKAYAQEGARVAITGRNEKSLEAAAKEIGDGTLAIQSDAGKVAEIEGAIKKSSERFGALMSYSLTPASRSSFPSTKSLKSCSMRP